MPANLSSHINSVYQSIQEMPPRLCSTATRTDAVTQGGHVTISATTLGSSLAYCPPLL